MQIASRLIRLQTLWSPGGQEQALSRVVRPDPREKYNRSELNFDWLLTNNSIEIAKTARLISKIINKAQIDENSNPQWDEVGKKFGALGLKERKMSLIVIVYR